MTRTPKKVDYPKEFVAFWKSSPRTGKKARAFHCYAQLLGEETHASLLAYVERWMTHPDCKRNIALRKSGQESFNMHVSTWLYNRDFENENNLGPAPEKLGETMSLKQAKTVWEMIDRAFHVICEREEFLSEVKENSKGKYDLVVVGEGRRALQMRFEWLWPATMGLVSSGQHGWLTPRQARSLGCLNAELATKLAAWTKGKVTA